MPQIFLMALTPVGADGERGVDGTAPAALMDVLGALERELPAGVAAGLLSVASDRLQRAARRVPTATPACFARRPALHPLARAGEVFDVDGRRGQ